MAGGENSTFHSRSEDETAAALAYVCQEFTEIRGSLERHGDPTALERLLAAVHEGVDPSHALDEIDAAVLADGDAFGLYGQSRTGAHPAGVGAPRRVESVFRCPAGRCSRYWLPETDNHTPPVCRLFGRGMRWERL